MRRFLSERGYTVETFHNGPELHSQLQKSKPDLLLLDVMLPGDDGFKILKNIRTKSDLPVIMLTARGEITDRIVGLQMGADDYLPKPFEPAELDMRIKAVLRRSIRTSDHLLATNESQKKIHPDLLSEMIVLGNRRLDVNHRKIITPDSEIELTSMEFRLLEYFIQNSNQVIHRSQITEILYGDDFDPYRRSIDILISRLRKKLEMDPAKPTILKTLHGQGYIFTR